MGVIKNHSYQGDIVLVGLTIAYEVNYQGDIVLVWQTIVYQVSYQGDIVLGGCQ